MQLLLQSALRSSARPAMAFPAQSKIVFCPLQQAPKTPAAPLRFEGKDSKWTWKTMVTFLTEVGFILSSPLTFVGGSNLITQGPRDLWTRTMKSYSKTLTPEENATLKLRQRDFLQNPNTQFHYFQMNANDQRFEEVPFTPYFKNASTAIANRMVEVLFKRPELLSKIQAQPVIIHLYDAQYLEEKDDNGKDAKIAGSCNEYGVFEFALGSVRGGLTTNNDSYEVVSHELTHRLDLMDSKGKLVGFDGYLPGWSAIERHQYSLAREAEKRSIELGLSPLRDYALENDDEFLAVLTEAYFEKPADLQESSPVLYGMMDTFFQQHRAGLAGPKKASADLISLGAGLLLFITATGAFLLRKSPVKPEPAKDGRHQ